MEIRLATEADAPAIAAIYRPIVVETVISFEAEPPDATEIWRRMSAGMPMFPWLVAVEGAEVVGYAYGSAHRAREAYRWSVDVSVYVGAAHRRRGVARGLYGALLDVLERQGYHAAHAGITLPNDASRGFHEAMGFRPVGVYPAVGWKHGRWHDVGWWQLRLRDGPAAPGEIEPVLDVWSPDSASTG